MANKAISELPQAQNVNNQDLFVLEQSGIAKKLTAETFITEQGIIDALAEALDGHGGIQSVMLASVSGRIRTYRITFSDGSATTFQVYDGTSIERISRTSSSGLQDTYTIFMSDGTTTFFTVTNGADGTVSEAMLNDALKDKAPAITETTESSAIANFTDGADNMVMHNVVVEINPVQSGSGDPSPSNIRPITGHTEVNVTRAGKNLWSFDNITSKKIYRANVAQIGDNPNAFYLGGASGDTNTMQLLVNSWAYVEPFTGMRFSVDTSITVSCKVKNYTENCNGFVRLKYNDTEERSGATSVQGVYFNNLGTTEISLTGTIPAGKYVFVEMSPAAQSSAVTLEQYAEVTDFQIEIGSTKTTFEQYQDTSLPISWQTEAGTVYGGTIDVATGLLTVDRAMVTMTGADVRFVGQENALWRIYTDALNDRFVGANVPYSISNKYSYVQEYTGINQTNNSYGFSANLGQMFIHDDTFTSLDEIQASLNSLPLEIVYTLATPQTYQLTPQEVKTLLGTNNVWTDTGNVSVTYPADTKMYIQNLTQPSEDDMTADHAIASGTFFMVGPKLYLSIASIASGAQIIEGTNARQLSLADALNTLSS